MFAISAEKKEKKEKKKKNLYLLSTVFIAQVLVLGSLRSYYGDAEDNVD